LGGGVRSGGNMSVWENERVALRKITRMKEETETAVEAR